MRPLLPLALALILPLAACNSRPRISDRWETPAQPALLAAAPAANDPRWKDLLAGGLVQWKSYGLPLVGPGPGWTLEGGVLTLAKEDEVTPDLMTRDSYGDFVLSFEYQAEPEANSGVMYRVDENRKMAYWNAVEFQVLDPAYRDEESGEPADALHAAGAVYGLYPTRLDLIRPNPEWNTGMVVAKGTRIEHWLNGVRIAAYDTAGADYNGRIALSKFRKKPKLGHNARGHIALQNHGDSVRYRNIRVLPLD